VAERVHDWREIYVERALLPIISEQAGRCMDCGVPFCHHGCPLGNVIPEWNDLVWRADWRTAAERLHATNNFPEFTGRLCPAPCESACVVAIDADAVTIKNVEVSIADQAWENGYVTPLPPERLSGKTVAVIGSGPAGLAAAQQLTRVGHTVAVYERDDRIGGLLRYGIPEFKMEKRHIDRRIEQMIAEGTRFRTGLAVGTDIDAAEIKDRYDAVVVAIGASVPRDLPVPGRELTGIHQAMDYLPMANRVVEGDYTTAPIDARDKHVVIVGGGDTGTDCVGTALRQGARSVTHVDINPQPSQDRPNHQPWPTYPKIYQVSISHEEARDLGRSQSRSPVGAATDGRVFAASTFRFDDDGCGRIRALHLIEVEPGSRQPKAGTERVIPADLVLLAMGFTGPEKTGVVEQLRLALDERGVLTRTSEFASTVDGVFVAGDAGRGPSLIVWAIAEGRATAAAVDRYLTGSTILPVPVTPKDYPLAV
jgi:glutamate synthase (NADPH/NADH) small chain